MSKIALSGNASGTGTLTIAAPNTSTDRTLTLPDSSGTMATAESTLAQFNASGSAPVYAARAWVNFNGQGTVAIRGSGNVSSITDNGSGLYTVNLTTAMPDTNYAMTGFLRRDTDSSTSAAYLTANATQTKSTSAVAVRTGYVDNGGSVGTADMPEIDIAIFR
jgi:hypothetical protein